mmetsp:Transcript_83000/g.96992  ORF Transcript_83000/g.96992 Transcript_83000/m.96992 type:complete len:205 (+) Transcript_83000:21-635(+)
MQNRTLKEKLHESKCLSTTLTNRVFMRTLYQILEDAAYHSTICWDSTGKKVLVKDTGDLIANVFPKFERCVTLINFFRRMEECRFYETMERNLGADHVFENLFFTREKKPNFDTDLKKKQKTEKSTSHPEEISTSKKVHKVSPQEMEEDLRTLITFEAQLQQQISQRTQLLKLKMTELDNDIMLSTQIRRLISSLQAGRILNLP